MTDGESVTFADQAAEDNGLACMIVALLRENLEKHPERRRDLDALRVGLAIVAQDAEVALSLQFAGGRCVVYDGRQPWAEITLVTDSERITKLSLLPLRYGLPNLLSPEAFDLARDLVERKMKLSGLGLVRHPLALVRVTRLLSAT